MVDCMLLPAVPDTTQSGSSQSAVYLDPQASIRVDNRTDYQYLIEKLSCRRDDEVIPTTGELPQKLRSQKNFGALRGDK